MQKEEIKKILDLLDRELAIANTNLLFLKELEPIITKNRRNLGMFFDYFFFAFISHAIVSILLLAKFFDKDPRSHSLYSVIEIINENEKQKFLDKLNQIKSNFEFYEDYRDKIIAHLDKTKSVNSITLPTLNFLKEENLPKIVKNIEDLLGELRDSFGFCDRWLHRYVSQIDNLKYTLNSLEKYVIAQKEERRKKYGI